MPWDPSPPQQLRREVKPSRGRRDGAAMGRINGLVTFAVEGLGVALAPHVRRQRRLAKSFQPLIEFAVVVELQTESAAPKVADHFRRHVRAETQNASHLWFFGGIDHSDPQTSTVVGKPLDQQDFDFAAAILCAAQARRKDFGIVEHQQIADIEKVAEFTKHAMNNLARGAAHHQQARASALPAGKGRDQRLGQLVIEFLEIHRNR